MLYIGFPTFVSSYICLICISDKAYFWLPLESVSICLVHLCKLELLVGIKTNLRVRAASSVPLLYKVLYCWTSITVSFLLLPRLLY
jgi:hypothetical protein